jgi:L-asparaginase
MKQTKVLIITTGGTILQDYSLGHKQYIKINDIIKDKIDFKKRGYKFDIFEASKTSGANLTFKTIDSIRIKLKSLSDDYHGVIILTGTDALEELAFTLDLTGKYDFPVAITGSMRPSDHKEFDGIHNFLNTLSILRDPKSSKFGVLVCMNNTIHSGRHVYKSDSQSLDTFKSQFAPIGMIKDNMPNFTRDFSPAMDNFDIESLGDTSKNILILTQAVGLIIHESVLDGLDGLVIAGMGSGSLSDQNISFLSKHTSRIPIVISTRCQTGKSFDNDIYKGSLEKYESKGFILKGYENLNPIQCRLTLYFNLLKKEETNERKRIYTTRFRIT